MELTMNDNKSRTPLQLTEQDEAQLTQLLNKGTHLASHYKRLLVLRFVAQGYTQREASQLAGCARSTVQRIVADYKQGGLELVLSDEPRAGRPPKLAAKEHALVVELACSKPPEGYARWTHELIELKLNELELAQMVSARTIGRILKKTKSQPKCSKHGATPK